MSKYELKVNIASGVLLENHPRKGGPYTDRPSPENPKPKTYPITYHANLESIELDEKMVQTNVAFNKHVASLVKSGIVILKDHTWDNSRSLDVGGVEVLVPSLDGSGNAEVDNYFDKQITDPMKIKEYLADTKIIVKRRNVTNMQESSPIPIKK